MRKHNALWLQAFVFVSALLARSTAQAAMVVEFDTNFGAFEVELFDVDKPISVTNFLNYANSGRYNNTIIHRSINNFVIQGGGYDTTGLAIPTNGPIMNEIGISNVRGTIAYANTGSPNSATSQWFFNVVDNIGLDSNFTVFGQVRGSGMNIVDLINALPTVNAGGPFTNLPVINPGGLLVPSNLVVINSITVVPEPGAMFLILTGLIVTGRWRLRS